MTYEPATDQYRRMVRTYGSAKLTLSMMTLNGDGWGCESAPSRMNCGFRSESRWITPRMKALSWNSRMPTFTVYGGLPWVMGYPALDPDPEPHGRLHFERPEIRSVSIDGDPRRSDFQEYLQHASQGPDLQPDGKPCAQREGGGVSRPEGEVTASCAPPVPPPSAVAISESTRNSVIASSGMAKRTHWRWV